MYSPSLVLISACNAVRFGVVVSFREAIHLILGVFPNEFYYGVIVTFAEGIHIY